MDMLTRLRMQAALLAGESTEPVTPAMDRQALAEAVAASRALIPAPLTEAEMAESIAQEEAWRA